MKNILRISIAIGLGLVSWIFSNSDLVQSIINGVLFYYIVNKGTLDTMFSKIFSAIPGVTVPTQKQEKAAIPGVTVPTEG